jgi:hypothetical protein
LLERVSSNPFFGEVSLAGVTKKGSSGPRSIADPLIGDLAVYLSILAGVLLKTP